MSHDSFSIAPIVPSPEQAEADASVSAARRRFAGLLALFGGGAALSACSGEASAEEVGRVGLAATGVASAATGDAIFWADTIAELRARNANSTPTVAIAIVAGAVGPGDGGGGIFRWHAAAPPTDDGGIHIVPSQTAGAGWWARQFGGAVSALWFLDKQTVVSAGPPTLYDHTPVIQAAVDAVYARYGNQGGTVYLPAFVYNCYRTVNIRHAGVGLLGDGPHASVIYFLPSAVTASADQSADIPTGDTVAINFDNLAGYNTSQRLGGCSLRHVGFTSAGTSNTLRRVAVRLVNTDYFLLEDVTIDGTWMLATTSATPSTIGIQVFSGQFVRLKELFMYADRPISIEHFGGSHAYTNHDHLTMFNVNTSASPHEAHILISDQSWVTNFAIEGNNNWSGGRWGLRCRSTISVAHYGITLRNIRAEQMVEYPGAANPDDRGHVIYLSSTGTAFQHVVIDNIRGPGAPHEVGGLFIRNAVPIRVTSAFLSTTPGSGPAPGMTLPAWRRPIDVADSVVHCEDFTFDATSRPQGGMYTVHQRGTATNTIGYAYPALAPRDNQYKGGMVRVTAVDTTSGLREGGVWLFDPNGVTLVSGTANVVAGNINYKLGLGVSGGRIYLFTSAVPGSSSTPTTFEYSMVIEYSA